LNVEYVLITRGEKGMSLIKKDGENIHIPAVTSEVYDVTGAGDTVAATLTLSLAAGASIEEAARLANWAAGVVVRKVGTGIATVGEIERAIRYNMRGGSDRKLLSLKELAEVVAGLKGKEKRIVFTNGCFDLLHAGHVKYLQEARDLGDILIVAINSDGSVKRIKGSGRPILPEEDRAQIIAALECVDYVTIFSEDTPVAVIERLKPDIHVKGGDYQVQDLPEVKIVESYGGKVVVVEEVKGKSTTDVISRIRKGT